MSDTAGFVYPTVAVQQMIEAVAADGSLTPRARADELRTLKEALSDMAGDAERRIGDLELMHQANIIVDDSQMMAARENADIREALLHRGMASPEQLDDMGFLSHEALTESLRDGEPKVIQEALGRAFGLGLLKGGAFNLKVRRGQGGKFSTKPGSGPVKKVLVGRDGKKHEVHATRPVTAVQLTDAIHTGADHPALHPAARKKLRERTVDPGRRTGTKADVARGQARGAVEKGPKYHTREEAQKALYQARTKDLGKRVKRKTKGADANPDASRNAVGRVDQTALLGYVRDAATEPTTADMHGTRGSDGKIVWDADRRELHRSIVESMLRQPRQLDGDTVPDATGAMIPSQEKPTVLFVGGGYAAGKSHAMRSGAVDVPKDALHLDPDKIKALLPEFTETAADDPEANLRVYEEAWDISQQLQRIGQQRRLNMVVDGIGDTSPDEMLDRVQSFTDAGYVNPRAAYMDVPTDMATERASRRATNATRAADKRHIPEAIVRAVHRDVAATVPAMMSHERAKQLGLKVDVFDTSGDAPKHVASFDGGDVKVHDRGKWQDFQDKGHEQLLPDEPVAMPEQIKADLEVAKKVGLNDWPPKKGEVAQKLLGDAVDTQALHQVDGAYTPERQAEHRRIIDELLGDKKPDPSGKKRVLFMGGGTASGKSSALKMDENRDVQPPDAVAIDPDEIKAMLPEYSQMIDGGDRYAAFATHEESSDISKELQAQAMERGLNLIIDGTGNSKPGKYVGKMKDMKAQGYDVSVFYVNAATDTAVVRATKRAQETGRWVPEAIIRDTHKGVSDRFRVDVMNAMGEGHIDSMKGYDTNGDAPVLMFTSTGDSFHVHDPVRLEAFQAKGDEQAAPVRAS